MTGHVATARRFGRHLERAWRIQPRVERRLVLRHLLDYRAWRRSLGSSETGPLQARLPWMTYAAIRFLRDQVRPDWRVFEYGSGGSSLFLADRVAELISVEHDPDWAEWLGAGGFRTGLPHWSLLLVPPEPPGPSEDGQAGGPFISRSDAHAGQDFERYCRSIEAVAGSGDGPGAGFDLIVVDGRARSGCLELAAPRVRPGGWLLLDDSQRRRYRTAMARIDGSWARRDFPGTGPGKRGFSRTTAWQRPRPGPGT